jgi:hypothetical protein
MLLRLSTTYLSGNATSHVYDPVFRFDPQGNPEAGSIIQAVENLMASDCDRHIFQEHMKNFQGYSDEMKSESLTIAADASLITRMYYRVDKGSCCQPSCMVSLDEVIQLIHRRNRKLTSAPQLKDDLRRMRRHMLLIPYCQHARTPEEKFALLQGETMLLCRMIKPSEPEQQHKKTLLGMFEDLVLQSDAEKVAKLRHTLPPFSTRSVLIKRHF